jgi:phenylacetate-CoA ligase
MITHQIFNDYNFYISEKGILALLAKKGFWRFSYAAGWLTHRLLNPISSGPIHYAWYSHFLKSSEYWTQEKLEKYQLNELKRLINYVYHNVPYYSELFKQKRIDPSDFRTLRDIERIPLLTKETVARNFDKLISRRYPLAKIKKIAEKHATSGSIGKPLIFLTDKRIRYRRLAYGRWKLPLWGIRRDAKYIKLWSRPFVLSGRKTTVLHHPFVRELSLSSVPQNKTVYSEYLRWFSRYKPDFIFGAPSFMHELAVCAEENGFSGISIPCFISCYENLYDYQKNKIKEQFKCRILRYYSTEEGIIYGLDCHEAENMHLDSRRGIVEIVDPHGKTAPHGESGEIVATGFDNYIMPLLRYRIGDRGSLSTEPCACGRRLPVLQNLEGRTGELLMLQGKALYPATLSVLLEGLTHIKECQFLKRSDDVLELKIVKRPSYSSGDESKLRKRLAQFIGHGITYSLKYVNEIERTELGKFQFVVNE